VLTRQEIPTGTYHKRIASDCQPPEQDSCEKTQKLFTAAWKASVLCTELSEGARFSRAVLGQISALNQPNRPPSDFAHVFGVHLATFAFATLGGYFLKRPLVTTPPSRYTLLGVDYVLIVIEASYSVY
jgi:hypothetical protein